MLATMPQDTDLPLTALRRRGFLAMAALGSGCAVNTDRDHSGDDAPLSAPLPRRPRLAWVLSSGGPRGFVHVGVLKALDELGVVPDLLVGASVGSMLAVLRAAGMTGLELERLALDLSPLSLARIANVFGGESERFSGAPVAEFIRDQLQDKVNSTRLEQLPIMVACVAQRIDGQRKTVAFNQGDAGLAVQASSAVEGQFTPVRIRGDRYVDADAYMPLPVRLARQMGAERVLAVDASAHEDRAPTGAGRYRNGDLRKRANTLPDARAANLTLHPDFGYWVSLSAEFRQRSIEAGYRDTMAQAARIKALHAG